MKRRRYNQRDAEMIAAGLLEPDIIKIGPGKIQMVPMRPKPKPSICKLVAAAEKIGKTVSSITTPDGTTLHFGEPVPTEASNPWLDDLKVTKQ